MGCYWFFCRYFYGSIDLSISFCGRLNSLLNASGDFSGWCGVWAFEREFNLYRWEWLLLLLGVAGLFDLSRRSLD